MLSVVKTVCYWPA